MQAPGVRTPQRASRLGGTTGLALVVLAVVTIALVPWLRATSPDPFETAMASSCDRLDEAVTLARLSEGTDEQSDTEPSDTGGSDTDEYTAALRSADSALGQAYEDSAAGSAQRADLAVLSEVLTTLSATSTQVDARLPDVSAAVEVCERY